MAPPGLVVELTGQRPRRIRVHPLARVVLAAAAVVLVLGGATLIFREHPNPDAFQRPRPTGAPPIATVWPEAVHKVAGTLPNGKAFAPRAFLDDHTMLVSTGSSFESADALYAYDLRARTARRITKVVRPAHAESFADGFTSGGGYVAWWLDGPHGPQIWAAPSTGGTAHRIVEQPGVLSLSRLTVQGRDVLWSANPRGGVSRAAT